MKINDLLIEIRIKKAMQKEKSKKIEQILLKSPHPEKIIDSLNLDPSEINELELSKEVLKRKVDGYKNLYEYIIKKTNCGAIYPKKSDCDDIELAQTQFEFNGYSSIGIDFLTEKLILSTLPNGKKVIDLLISNRPFIFNYIMITDIELAKELINRNRLDLIKNASIDVLKYKISDNIPIIKELLDHDVVPNILNVTRNTDDLFDVNVVEQEDILFKNIADEKKLIDYLIDSNVDVEINLMKIPKEMLDNIINSCIKFNRLKMISSGPEEIYTKKIKIDDKEISLFKYMQMHGIIPNVIGKITSPEVIKAYLLDRNKNSILIENCSCEILTSPIEANNLSPIDIIIERELSEKNKLKNSSASHDTNSLRSLIVALNFGGKIDEKMAIKFAQHGCFISPTNKAQKIGLNKDNKMQEYIYQEESIQTQEKYKKIINKLRSIYSDGQSNIQIIENIISVFNNTVLFDEETAIRDIIALINYKEVYPEFKIIYNPNSESAFLPKKNITLENKDDKFALTHEWGHLIHDLYLDGKTPDPIKDLIPHTCNYGGEHPYETLNLFNTIEKEAEELLNESRIIKEFIKYIYYSKGSISIYKDEIRSEYRALIGTDMLLIETLKSQDITKNVKKAITDAIYGSSSKEEYLTDKCVEEYVIQRSYSELKQFQKIAYQKENSEFLCYENFIDAYYGGALGSVLYGKKTSTPTCTHDTMYFMQTDRQFKEMFANYVELKKSPNGLIYIEKLKDKTSPELILKIEDLYKNIYVNTKKGNKRK